MLQKKNFRADSGKYYCYGYDLRVIGQSIVMWYAVNEMGTTNEKRSSVFFWTVAHLSPKIIPDYSPRLAYIR